MESGGEERVALGSSFDAAEVRFVVVDGPCVKRVTSFLRADQLGQGSPAPVDDVPVAQEPELGKRQASGLAGREEPERRITAGVEGCDRVVPGPRRVDQQAVSPEAIGAMPGVGLAFANDRGASACSAQGGLQRVWPGCHAVRVKDPDPRRPAASLVCSLRR